MIDIAAERLDQLFAMRAREAALVTALIKLGGKLDVTQKDAFDAAAHTVDICRVPDGLQLSLKAAQ